MSSVINSHKCPFETSGKMVKQQQQERASLPVSMQTLECSNVRKEDKEGGGSPRPRKDLKGE